MVIVVYPPHLTVIQFVLPSPPVHLNFKMPMFFRDIPRPLLIVFIHVLEGNNFPVFIGIRAIVMFSRSLGGSVGLRGSAAIYKHQICAFEIALLTLLNALPCLVSGHAIPVSDAVFPNDLVLPTVDHKLSPRADGGWGLVIYDAHRKGQQCGGSYQGIKGTSGSGQCLRLKQTACAKVIIDKGWFNCEFDWAGNNCGDVKTTTKIDLGTEEVVGLPDVVKFVTVKCSK
ncbi:hypothetical protein BBP40_004967 [Aspergillus hancockii]|nr:hypothetical protein BBP40_004967 [Aspergillus hancockii]